MKPESKTIGQSRTWAHNLCGALESSFGRWETASEVRLYEFWDNAWRQSQGQPYYKVLLRWGRTPSQLARLRCTLRAEMEQAIVKRVN